MCSHAGEESWQSWCPGCRQEAGRERPEAWREESRTESKLHSISKMGDGGHGPERPSTRERIRGRVRGVALAAAPRPHRPSSTSSFLPAVPIPRTSPSTPISALWCSSGSSPCFSLANSRCFCPNATLLVTGFPIHTLLLSAPRANNLSGRNTLYDIYAMLEDKYIGLSLAVSSSLAIGTSFILTKKVCSLQVCHYLSRDLAATAK